LVAPLLSGVNAGDADHLSLATGAAQLAAAARRSPSLVGALRAQQQSALDARADPTAPVFYGIPIGTQTLTDLLFARLTSAGVPVRLRCPVSTLAPADRGWRVQTATGLVDADGVVLATPAPASARLLESVLPDVATELGNLEYASVAMVTLAVPRAAIEHPLDASGFLVASTDPLPCLTACSWASTKWAHLADPELAILRASAGRFGDTAALELGDDDLVAAVVADLATTVGLGGLPVESRVTRWIDGLPQFRPGHLGRVRAWRATVDAVAPGLVLAGAAYDGLGLPACIRQGREAARAVLSDPPVRSRPTE
jgi:oxygen-dependent protoporphyrinogen oxidase